MDILDVALLLCPKEFRREYGQDIRADASSEKSPALAALDVAIKGIELRIEGFARDIAFASRVLLKNRLFTVVAIATLAIAFSVNTAVFGVIESVLLKPLPFVQPDRLAFLCVQQPPAGCGAQFPSAAAASIAAQSRTIEAVGQFQWEPITITGFGLPQSAFAALASINVFDVLGVRPELGRFFTRRDGEPGARSIVISDRLWRALYAANPRAIGRTLTMGGESWRVVGVAPANFVLPQFYDPSLAPEKVSVFTPLPNSTANWSVSLNNWAFVRLRPKISGEAAQADLDRVMGPLLRGHRDQLTGITPHIESFADWYFNANQARTMLLLALCAVLAVLLIACANVANLLLVRNAARNAELSVRAALGASQGRIARQLMVELGLLASISGAFGLLAAWGELAVLRAVNPSIIPRVQEAGIDGRVVLIAVLTVALAVTVAGIAPALFATRTNLSTTLKAARVKEGRSGSLLRAGLAIGEIALAFAVVASAGLFVRSASTIAHQDLGMNPHDLYGALVYMEHLNSARYDDPRWAAGFVRRVVPKVRVIPGVEDVSVSRAAPFLKNGPDCCSFRLAGRSTGNAQKVLQAPAVEITPAFFKVFGIPLMRGRVFTDGDRRGSPHVAIVNQTFVATFFGGKDPIGKQIWLQSYMPPWDPVTVVGVVADVTAQRYQGPWMYVPFAQLPSGVAEIAIRMRGTNPDLRAEVSSAVAAADPSLGIINNGFFSVDDQVARSSATQRTSAELLGIMALAALLLALAGTYAVIAYSVAQRTHEFGIRKALGAATPQILRNVLAVAAWYGAAGIVIGIVLVAVCMSAVSYLLVQTSPLDPATLGCVGLALLSSALVAAVVPAMRAAAVDPVQALRYE